MVWNRMSMVVVTLMLFMSVTARSLPAQTSPTTSASATSAPVSTSDPTEAITLLRQELIDSFNKGDLDRLLSHLDEDVVITWQNGEVCRGPEAVRAYYNKMMTGPERRVEKVSADPKVDGRHVYGGWAVSWGHMNDHFVLTDGSELAMDSRFTATIAQRGSVWKVSSFHVSVNAFDNPILAMVAKKAGTWAMFIGVFVGLLVGLIAGMFIKRSRRGRAAATAGPVT
jgi:ketosteroid isomerase-like protein